MNRGEPLVRIFLLVEYFDLCRLEGNHGTAAAALLAPPAFPAVLAEVLAAALLAVAAPPPVLAKFAAAALLALAAPPPVLADSAAAAVFALAQLPPVRTGHGRQRHARFPRSHRARVRDKFGVITGHVRAFVTRV